MRARDVPREENAAATVRMMVRDVRTPSRDAASSAPRRVSREATEDPRRQEAADASESAAVKAARAVPRDRDPRDPDRVQLPAGADVPRQQRHLPLRHPRGRLLQAAERAMPRRRITAGTRRTSTRTSW